MIFSKDKWPIVLITLAVTALLWKNWIGTSSTDVPRQSEFSIPRFSTEPAPSQVNNSELAPTKNLPKALPVKLSPSVAHQMQVLDQILASKNDNDLRMDTELKVLSSEAKTVLKEKYASLPMVQRNERGTIIFLIGRNLNEASDYQFLKEVLSEMPCLGLSDCGQPMKSEGLSGHGDNGIELVLDYPQWTALKAIENHPALTESLKAMEVEALQAGKHSKSSKISEAAEALGRKIR